MNFHAHRKVGAYGKDGALATLGFGSFGAYAPRRRKLTPTHELEPMEVLKNSPQEPDNRNMY
jgi:hypothetical protein